MAYQILNGEDLLIHIDNDDVILKKIESKLSSYPVNITEVNITIDDYCTYVFKVVDKSDELIVYEFLFSWS